MKGWIDERTRNLIIGFVIAFIGISALSWVTNGSFVLENGWLNEGLERSLGIPFNIHHDFIGLLLIMSGVVLHKKLDKNIEWYLIGAGLGLFVQHMFTEGVVLISALS